MVETTANQIYKKYVCMSMMLWTLYAVPCIYFFRTFSELSKAICYDDDELNVCGFMLKNNR